jgi:uncharacterized protein YjbJ (UPF0337 family)
VGERADRLSDADLGRIRRDDESDLVRAAGNEASDDPRAIAGEIELTRSEMSGTIDEIQRRIDPEQLGDQAVTTATEITDQARDAAKDVAKYAIDEAKTAVRELADHVGESVRASTVGRVEDMATKTRHAAESTGDDLWTLIKHNPVPAAMAAIGIGWLWSQRSNGSNGQTTRMRNAPYGSSFEGYEGGYGLRGDYGYGYPASQRGGSAGSGTMSRARGEARQMAGQVQEAAEQAQQKAENLVSDVQQRAGEAVDQVQQITNQAANRVEYRTDQLQHKAMSTVDSISDDPLVVGALGLMLGAAVGFILPETERENELMGEAREQFVDRVEEVGSETIDKVQRAAPAAREAAKKAAMEAISEQDAEKSSGGRSAQRSGAKSGSTAPRAPGQSGESASA